MALEDAVTLGKALAQCEGDAAKAFALYESVRIPRTARIVWSTREMGRVYHAAGVERQVRNLLWKGKSRGGILSRHGMAVRLERRKLSSAALRIRSFAGRRFACPAYRHDEVRAG